MDRSEIGSNTYMREGAHTRRNVDLPSPGSSAAHKALTLPEVAAKLRVSDIEGVWWT